MGVCGPREPVRQTIGVIALRVRLPRRLYNLASPRLPETMSIDQSTWPRRLGIFSPFGRTQKIRSQPCHCCVGVVHGAASLLEGLPEAVVGFVPYCDLSGFIEFRARLTIDQQHVTKAFWPAAALSAAAPIWSLAGGKRTSRPSQIAFAFDPSVWTGRALQAENDDLGKVGLAHLYPAY